MIRKELIKGYINNLQGRTEDDIFNRLLNLGESLSPGEKNTVFAYLCPQNLRDGELVELVQKKRSSSPNGLKGTMEPSEVDIPLFMNAYKTRQYRGFIRHLLHSFIKCDKNDLYIPEDNKTYECALCGKIVSGSLIPGIEQEYRAYQSTNTDITLCPDCLMQLHILDDILKDLEGEYYLTWGTVIKKK